MKAPITFILISNMSDSLNKSWFLLAFKSLNYFLTFIIFNINKGN